MICKPCTEAAEFQKKWPDSGRQHTGHAICKGCDCQHRPVKEGQIKK